MCLRRQSLSHNAAIGLGCISIGIADVYTSSAQDDTKAMELIHRVLDLDFLAKRLQMRRSEKNPQTLTLTKHANNSEQGQGW